MAIQLERGTGDFEIEPPKPLVFKSTIAPDVVGPVSLKPDEMVDPEIIEIMGMFGRRLKPKELTVSETFYAAEAAIVHPRTNLRPLMLSMGRRVSEVGVATATMAGVLTQISPTFPI